MGTTRFTLALGALVFVSLFGSLLDAASIPSSVKGLDYRSLIINLKRNPDYSPNGPAEYARALRKWGAKVPEQLIKSLAAMAGAHGHPSKGEEGELGDVPAVSIRNDREYLSPVGFGTPVQWLNLDLDTGSADVWIYTTDTHPYVAQSRDHVFRINESSTAEKVHNTTWWITYGDGSSAYGGVYRDVVTLANITVHNATVESAISVSNSLIQDPYMDGIFGLAYRLPVQTSPKQPTVLSSLLPLLNEPLFTVDLRWRSPDGVYTFGYIDHERHSGHIKYTSLLPGAQFWELEYTGIHVEGQDRWYKSTQIPWRAIVDTGTTLILTPQDVSDLYFSDVPNAMFNESIGGVWTYPCNNPVLPDFEISFDSGFIARIPGKYMNYTNMPDNPKVCMGGLQGWDDSGRAIFGDVFLKAVYTVFDVGQGRVGFAPKKF